MLHLLEMVMVMVGGSLWESPSLSTRDFRVDEVSFGVGGSGEEEKEAWATETLQLH